MTCLLHTVYGHFWWHMAVIGGAASNQMALAAVGDSATNYIHTPCILLIAAKSVHMCV